VFLGKTQNEIISGSQLGVACRKEEYPAPETALHPRHRSAMRMTVVGLEFHILTRVRLKQFAQPRAVRFVALMENDRRRPDPLGLKNLHRATLHGFPPCLFLPGCRKEKRGY